MEAIVQKIKKEYNSDLEFARVYYSVLFELNKIKVTSSELNLVAFSSVFGTLSTPPVRDQFMNEFKIPKGSFYNMMSKLQKSRILVKLKGKIRVNPAIQLDFTKKVYNLNITLVNLKPDNE